MLTFVWVLCNLTQKLRHGSSWTWPFGHCETVTVFYFKTGEINPHRTPFSVVHSCENILSLIYSGSYRLVNSRGYRARIQRGRKAWWDGFDMFVRWINDTRLPVGARAPSVTLPPTHCMLGWAPDPLATLNGITGLEIERKDEKNQAKPVICFYCKK